MFFILYALGVLILTGGWLIGLAPAVMAIAYVANAGLTILLLDAARNRVRSRDEHRPERRKSPAGGAIPGFSLPGRRRLLR